MTNKTAYKKTCEYCQKEFFSYRATTRYCNVKCNSKAITESRRKNQVKKHNKTQTRKTKKAIQPEFLSISATALFLGVSRPTVYKMIENGQLQTIRISERVIRIKKTDINQLKSN